MHRARAAASNRRGRHPRQRRGHQPAPAVRRGHAQTIWTADGRIHRRAPFFLTAGARAGDGSAAGAGSSTSRRCNPCARSRTAPRTAPPRAACVQLTRAIAEAWSAGRHLQRDRARVLPDAVDRAGVRRPRARWPQCRADRRGRNGVLEDLHGAAVFLASNASAYVTGQTLMVDGGFTAK